MELTKKEQEEAIEKIIFTEEWRPIKGYEGLYEISNFGRVKSLNSRGHQGKEQIMKQWKLKDKVSLQVGLCKNGVCKVFTVSHLVNEMFYDRKDTFVLMDSDYEWKGKIRKGKTRLQILTGKEKAKHARSFHERTVIQISKETGKVCDIFFSIKEASKATGVPYDTMKAYLKGRYAPKKGEYLYEYLNPKREARWERGRKRKLSGNA